MQLSCNQNMLLNSWKSLSAIFLLAKRELRNGGSLKTNQYVFNRGKARQRWNQKGLQQHNVNRSDRNVTTFAWTKHIAIVTEMHWELTKYPFWTTLHSRKTKCPEVFKLSKLKSSLLALRYSEFQKLYSQSYFVQILTNTVPWDILVKKAKEVLERAYVSKTAAASQRGPVTRGWITERRLCPRIHSFCPRGAENAQEQEKYISIKLGKIKGPRETHIWMYEVHTKRGSSDTAQSLKSSLWCKERLMQVEIKFKIF